VDFGTISCIGSCRVPSHCELSRSDVHSVTQHWVFLNSPGRSLPLSNKNAVHYPIPNVKSNRPIDNCLVSFSLKNSLEGSMLIAKTTTTYKSTAHHKPSIIGKWFLQSPPLTISRPLDTNFRCRSISSLLNGLAVPKAFRCLSTQSMTSVYMPVLSWWLSLPEATKSVCSAKEGSSLLFYSLFVSCPFSRGPSTGQPGASGGMHVVTQSVFP
jgi:hypothetical protein